MATCAGCGKHIKHRSLGRTSNDEPVMRWAVDPADKDGQPTYVCAGTPSGGGGWTITAYHEPEKET